MSTSKARATPALSEGTLNLDDVSQTLPASAPITRSLSKASLRDSNPKQPPPPRAQVIDRAEDDISVQPTTNRNQPDLDYFGEPPLLPQENASPRTSSCIEALPAEILDLIIACLGGSLGFDSSGAFSSNRNWNAVLRHPRRKDVSNLALVSPTWRELVQQRIFRHIKIHGTQPALSDIGEFFLAQPHLQGYVRHLQVIVPLWETKRGGVNGDSLDQNVHDRETSILNHPVPHLAGQGIIIDHQAEVSHLFQPSTKRATLAEIFAVAQFLFPDLQALTIESAHCKHPPQIMFFRPPPKIYVPSQPSRSGLRIIAPPGPDLPKIPSVKVLILRGAWNIIRDRSQLETVSAALPNLEDTNFSYHAPKTAPYMTMCNALARGIIPEKIRHVNLCLEGLYSKVPDSLAKWKKVYPEHHICRTLGDLLPQLESLTYTGRVCGSLFSEAVRATQQCHYDRLQTRRIDIVVKNVCRDPKSAHDGTGIHNWPFILAFESLVVQAMRALARYPRIDFLRIRFIDLDSPDGSLNPSFHLENNAAWGFWSMQIHELLHIARSKAVFLQRRSFPWPLTEADPRRKKSISIDEYRDMLNRLR